MPLKLIPPRKGKSPFWSVKGTYIGVHIDRSTKTGKRAVAVQILKKWERDIERGSYAEPGEATFASAATSYMNAGGERKYLRKLLEHFGDKPISEIGQAQIDEAAVHLYPNAGAATRNRSVYTPASAVLRHGGHRLDLRRPHGAMGGRQTAWLWPEQAESIFEEAGKIDKEFAALLIVLCYTGLRLSEALNLTWDNVRLADGYAFIPDTKNDEPRAVFLPQWPWLRWQTSRWTIGEDYSDLPSPAISIHFCVSRSSKPVLTFHSAPPSTYSDTPTPPGCDVTPGPTAKA